MIDVPESVLPLFEAAGWSPGRSIEVQFGELTSLRSYPLAKELITTFGGLKVGTCGRGRDCAKSDIEFTASPSIETRIAVAKLESPGDDLFPLGDSHRKHADLFLDASGRVHAWGVPDGSLCVVGSSFGDAVERLLLGYDWIA